MPAITAAAMTPAIWTSSANAPLEELELLELAEAPPAEEVAEEIPPVLASEKVDISPAAFDDVPGTV